MQTNPGKEIREPVGIEVEELLVVAIKIHWIQRPVVTFFRRRHRINIDQPVEVLGALDQIPGQVTADINHQHPLPHPGKLLGQATEEC